MAKLRVTGKRFSINGMFGITMIAVLIVAVASVVAAAIILPQYADATPHETPDVVAIVAPDNGLISVGADLSQVFVTVKYSDGSSAQVALSEFVVTGLDTSTEGTLDDVVLDYGGFKQTISFNVVPTELQIEYVASTGGRIDGDTLQSITAGADATRVEAVADEGYYFAGWSDGDLNASRLDKQISKSMRLIAKFEKLRYTVVFYYPDGTTAREEIVAYNEAPLRVPRPDEHNMEMYGYRFVGWDVDYTHITKDTNIHPIYEKYSVDFHIEYTIDGDGNRLGTSDALEYYANDEVATVRVMPTGVSNDYTFIGWSIYDVDLQAWVNLEPHMSNSKLIKVGVNYPIGFLSTSVGEFNEHALTFTPDENIDDIYVKAHFVYNESTITFTSMNNEVRAPINISYQTPIGDLFDVEDLTYLTNLGYAFKGWYANGGEVKEDGSPVLVNNQTMFTQPTELVAYWEKEIFTVVFLKGDNQSTAFTDPSKGYVENFGGQNGINGRVVTAYYQDNLAGAVSGAFPEEIPIKENYTFKGWYLADADRLPTNRVVDRTFKLETSISYVVPVFEVNTKELAVSISGSGSIYTLVDLGEGVYDEKSISNRIGMPVTQNYSVRIRPSEGYALTAVTVNGTRTTGTDLAGIDGYYDITIEAIIATDYEIKAEFSLTEYTISVTNGTAGTNHGTITHGILGTTSNQSSTLENVVATINYGSSVSIEIDPRNGTFDGEKYYIASVSLNGINLEVPFEAVYYNLVIENIIENQNVVITYRDFRYRVTLPENSTYGEMTAVNEVSEHERGDQPSFSIQAKEGYYIRRVTANGTIIDPYISAVGYTINSLQINGKDYDGTSNDYRVTKMDLMIGYTDEVEGEIVQHGIDKDVKFEVEYAELYYNVTTSFEGVGSVDAPFTASYGGSFQVKAVTSSGYYVHSLIVNGNEQVYDDVQLAREYNIVGINKDYDVRFTFKRTTYFVRVEDSNGYSSVTYNDQTISLVGNQGYTFTGIEHSSTVNFSVATQEGYQINKITVTSNSGESYDETINFLANSHVVTLSNVRASYSIEIDCLPINLDYKVYLINKANNEISINNVAVNSSSYASTVSFGGEISVRIALDDDHDLSLENVIVKNKDARDTYFYEALVGEYNKADDHGYYSILASSGSEDISLFVYDTKTAIDIYIYFEEKDKDSATNVLNYGVVGNGTLTVTDASSNELASGSMIAIDSEIKLSLAPQQGSIIKALIVNGQEVAVIDNAYSFTLKKDTDVCAIFGETQYAITVQKDTPNGIIASNKSLVLAGTSFTVRLTPEEGYYVSNCVISIVGRDDIQPFAGNTSGGFKEYVIPADVVVGDVMVTAQFAPVTHTLTYTHSANGALGGVGTAGQLDVLYGETKKVEIKADEGYYISNIVLNGEAISIKSLIGTPIASGEYIAGDLHVNVSGDVTLHVDFSPMVYRITINESLGGTTLVKKGDSAYLPAKEVKLGAGDHVFIKMEAEKGYHIASLEVPGRDIGNWNENNVSANDLNQVFFDLGIVSGDITVIVKYEINQYQINVNAINTSPNFSAIDVDNNTFGTVTVNGLAPDNTKLYTHGSNVKFVVTPRTARGYYIYKFELVYLDDEGVERSEIVNSINVNGGSYILRGISRDITAVNVEFKRRSYSYSQSLTIESNGSSWLSNGNLSITFKNPYTNAPVIVENQQYEYGLSYSISVVPGVGYKILPEERDENDNIILSSGGFKFNGESRLSAVRNNLYVGTVTSDINIEAIYVIEILDVSMLASNGGNYAIYDLDNTILWAPGINILQEAPNPMDWNVEEQGAWTLAERQTSTGIIWASADGLKVTYGTELVFSATPDTSIGHMIKTFALNNVNATISNEDDTMRATRTIEKDTYCEVAFAVHTYSIEHNTFVGGFARVSTSIVEWNNSVTIDLDMDRGYVMKSVKVNGEEKQAIALALAEYGTYTEAHVFDDWNIEITLANKEYDVKFMGDYASVYEVVQNGQKVKEVSAVSGVIINDNVFGKERREYYTNMEDSFSSEGNLLNKAVFADKLTIILTAPNGYRITSVSITMDIDGGGVISNLVNDTNGLIGEGNDKRSFTISSMTGNVTIMVNYAIKQYSIEYLYSGGGRYESTGITLVSHHELFTLNLISDDGYYLSKLDINGRIIPTVYTKDGMRYKYTTTTKVSNKDKLLEIDDALVNGESKITVLPIFEKQKFDVSFIVNNVAITNQYKDETLDISLANNQLVYDGTVPSVINQTLKEGYSITSIAFYNMPKTNQLASYYNFALEGAADRDYNLYSPKGSTLFVMLDEAILSMMDFHSVSQNVIRIYYTTAIDQHDANTSMYLIQSETQNNKVVNVGKTIDKSAVPIVSVGGSRAAAFSLTTTFNDNKDIVKHEYGTEAKITVTVLSNDYSFQGFQEYVHDEWRYVSHDPENTGITLQANGQELRYTMTSTRTFRAVFFRVYEVVVQIHPEYKYYSGSFGANNPSDMRYIQYASLTATATYSQNADNGVVLPNVSGVQETIYDTDGISDATYTYKVLSGARLSLRGVDRVSENPTRGYTYSVITYENGKQVQRDDGYSAGVETLEDRLVYAHFNNSMRVSFAMETVGSTLASEGGKVTYAKDGVAVSQLDNNSLSINPKQTLTVTIQPNKNYRFDGILELLPLANPAPDGSKQFSNTYSPLTSSEDGRIVIEYYDDNYELIDDVENYYGRIGKVVLTINNINESAIYKIRFWKQVEVRSSVSIITDEKVGHVPSYDISLDSAVSSVDGLYDYNANLFYDVQFGLYEPNFTGFRRYYQFVGYFINGVNAYTQLLQNYPSTYEGSFVLNDLDGLSNGVNIIEKTTVIEGVSSTSFYVDIVARFVPIYNVVIENEYVDGGIYLNPGQITASTVMYDEGLTQYFTSSANVEAKLGEGESFNTDASFQMLGKINTIDNSNKNSATSSYNTWNDNTITLNWISESDSFSFIAWQYYAYDAENETFAWKNIPYVDPNSQTNLVTKGTFTFPISCLFSTTYPAFISNTGALNEGGFYYNASQYDYDGNYVSSNPICAIRIKPVFQKVEKLTLVKSTALYSENEFLEGQGDANPKINSNSRSSGYFNFNTIQTIVPAAGNGYEFAGWYIADRNSLSGYTALNEQALSSSYDKEFEENGSTYYLKSVTISDPYDGGKEKKISYSYNKNTQQATVLMDETFTIYARYIRIYEINIQINNLSGKGANDSNGNYLLNCMPKLHCWVKVDGVWVERTEISNSRTINIKDARVGSQIMFTLETDFSGNINDTVRFNPMFDRFVGITSVNENNQNVWDGNGSTDATDSINVPTIRELNQYILGGTEADMADYNDAIIGMQIIITANSEKYIDINFESFGTLVLQNVYIGSAIKLPYEMGEALYSANPDAVEIAPDALGNDAYFVKDGGTGDCYDGGIVDGIISINSIPIRAGRSFDGEQRGDYATRLIDSINVLDSDNSSFGIDFDGSSIAKKVQYVVYYGEASWKEYEYVGGVLTSVEHSGRSDYDYPFAEGGDVDNAGNGTSSKPFKIANVDHLRNIDNLYKGNNGSLTYVEDGISSILRVHFKQVADINLNDGDNALKAPLCAPFTTNGVSYSNGFNGIYDGNNYKLYNLNLNTTMKEYVGIFSKVYRGGVIKNVALGRSYVKSSAEYVGVLAGSVYGGTIENVYYVEHGSQNISNNVTGLNYVGGLVGLLTGDGSAESVINNSNIAYFTVSASVGGSYLGMGRDYVGGAGGLVGSIDANARVSGTKNGYTVKNVSVVSGSAFESNGVGGGGIVGTIAASSNTAGQIALQNVVAEDVLLASEKHQVAIGGIAGSIGANRIVDNASLKAVDRDITVRSYSSPAGFTEPTFGPDGNYLSYGGGGIAGYNNGTIVGSKVSSVVGRKINLTGSMVGGLTGINLGTVENSSVSARLYTERQKEASFEGGTYGGMVGYNLGRLSGGSITGSKAATNDYNQETAAYEVVTGDKGVYVPTSGANSAMGGGYLESDTAYIYVGGVVGYNESMGEVSGVVNNSKLMVNRRSNDELANISYVGAICGYSVKSNTISSSGTAYIKFFHYLWVDPKTKPTSDNNTDTNQRMVAYIGNDRGNGTGATTKGIVYATAEYIGGGSFYDSASDSISLSHAYASSYMKGTASVYFFNTNGTASSYAPDWNSGNTIESAAESSKVYASDCLYSSGSIAIYGAWNYSGQLRYVEVSSYSTSN